MNYDYQLTKAQQNFGLKIKLLPWELSPFPMVTILLPAILHFLLLMT